MTRRYLYEFEQMLIVTLHMTSLYYDHAQLPKGLENRLECFFYLHSLICKTILGLLKNRGLYSREM